MIVSRASDDPTLARWRHGSGGWVTVYLGTHEKLLSADEERPSPGALYPMAFLVEQGAGYVVRPHFHAANQFQVFLGGKGSFGKRAFTSPMVHYADAYTPYGPIQAGETGFAYFTLRDSWDAGPQYMPESRDALRASPRSGEPQAISPSLGGENEQDELAVFPAREDGLAAWVYRIRPHQPFAAPAPSNSGGQYWIVLEGALAANEKTLPARSCLFRSYDEAWLPAVAGEQGLKLLVLQYPCRRTLRIQ